MPHALHSCGVCLVARMPHVVAVRGTRPPDTGADLRHSFLPLYLCALSTLCEWCTPCVSVSSVCLSVLPLVSFPVLSVCLSVRLSVCLFVLGRYHMQV